MGKKPSGVERGLEFVSSHTWQLKERMWMENLAENMPTIRAGKDIRELLKCNGSAIVVGAGESVTKYTHLETIEGSGYGGMIIATDKMLKPCLREGIAPNLVMTADGDPIIASFYDGAMEIVRGVFKFQASASKKTKAVLNALTVHPDTVAKCPYEKFWYITAIDDPLAEKSLTRAIHFMAKKTIMSSFGCVGGQAFNLAYFLQADPVILVGMDYGYLADTPLEQTAYYGSYKWLAEKKGKKIEQFFTKIRNPDTGEEVMIDANWSVYRNLALGYFAKAKCKIINCSPVSSLFGKNITHIPLEEALKKWGS